MLKKIYVVKIWCFLKIKKNLLKFYFEKWLEISYDGSFGVTVVSEKESWGVKIFVKCREKYLGI